MDEEDLESRVKHIFSQAKPAKPKKQVRSIFLILLILTLLAPLAISQTPQEPIKQIIYTYPVPPYQSQVRTAEMQPADCPIYYQSINQTCVGCSFFKAVQFVKASESGSKKI